MTKKELQDKISNLESEIKKQSGYVTEITQAIDKLTSDKATSLNNINVLNGAIQAYKDVINNTKEDVESDKGDNG
jgi:hypothetical protein